MVVLRNTEVGIYSALDKAIRLVGSEKLITSVYKNQWYNDEPRFFQYTAVIREAATLLNTHDGVEIWQQVQQFREKKLQ